MTRLKILASIAFLSMALTSCGGDEGLSGKVEFDALPDNPLVINADLTIGAGDDAKKILKPWFEGRFKFVNNSGKTLVVVTLIYKVTSTKDGLVTEQEYSIDPQEFCADDQDRPYLGVIADGQTFTGYAPDTSGDPFSRCDETDPLPSNEYERFIFGELAKSDSTIYSIQVTAEGWFENSDGEITERLIASDFITTR